MGTTLFLSKIIGPVLVLRGLSIILDREHFYAMIDGLEQEMKTISFSLVPVALLMAGITVATLHEDTSSIAGVIIFLTAWGMIIKASLLILVPRLLARKIPLIRKFGFIYVVCVMTLVIGVYLCYVGYFA